MTVERVKALWDASPTGLVVDGEFHELKGRQAHEVAVGPVHAGVIEPGHFRFQCLGEDVHHLEIALGYQRRGALERIVAAENDVRRLAIAETVAGDTSVAAGMVAAAALGIASPYECAEFPALGKLLLELERIANHVGDLGALAGDVAYLPTASFCGRIRGEYLNMTALLTGNRFGRALLPVPTPTEEKLAKLREWFARTQKECFHALKLLFSETSAVARFEGTGRVSKEVAQEIGLVGVAGRASGLELGPWPSVGGGDVLARARQRYEELKVSHRLVSQILEGNQAVTPLVTVATEGDLRVASVDAWRGELVHAVRRDAEGRLTAYRVFDPSFFNWFGLAQALRNEQISNFPICNKSFNLSYCGVDC